MSRHGYWFNIIEGIALALSMLFANGFCFKFQELMNGAVMHDVSMLFLARAPVLNI
jgi:hypothetical protein